MKFIHTKDFNHASKEVASIMVEALKRNDHANFCLASGGSPDVAYDMFVEEVLQQNIGTEHMVVTKLDEWLGIDKDSPLSCEKYIRDKVLTPLHIKEENYIGFMPDTPDANKEVDEVAKRLEKHPIDVCILGFGVNGHLGLNEPGEYAYPNSYVTDLCPETKLHPMLQGNNVTRGMTIGMKDIMDAKHVILIMSGEKKKTLYEQFLTKEVTTKLPASFLWLHDHVTVIVRDDQF